MSAPAKGPGVAEIVVGDDPAAWTAAGFAVVEDRLQVGSTVIRLVGASDPRGIRSWSLRVGWGGGQTSVDGLPTSTAPAEHPVAAAPVHANAATAIDHIVVGSPNRERTVAVLEDRFGLVPRRQAEHEMYGRAMVQTFYILGDLVLEVISRPDAEGDGPSTFWGLAFTVADIDATAAHLGGVLGAPRDAVQPGRRIAALRGDDIGVSCPVAFLTPREAGGPTAD